MDSTDSLKILRKYDSNFRKKLINKFSQIKEKKVLCLLYEVVREDNEKNISQNKSGIYFNLNKLNDDSIEKIVNILDEYDKKLEIEKKDLEDKLKKSDTEKLIYKQYSEGDHLEQFDNLGPRLSNQERSILKKFKNLNENP